MLKGKNKIVLVGVVKNKKDLDILLNEGWYRIPQKHAPKRKFHYLAFYQPAIFGREGKRIKYYARVLNYQINQRINLLPSELEHPRAGDDYLKIRAGKIQELPRPIKNIIPRRVYFGFTTLKQLLKSKSILQLYNIPATEQIVEDALRRVGIKFIAQHPITINKKRFRLDLAIFCQNGKIAIECDNKKAHANPVQRRKDKIKDATLRQGGWKVIRLPEDKIVSDLPGCLARIKKTIQKLNN